MTTTLPHQRTYHHAAVMSPYESRVLRLAVSMTGPLHTAQMDDTYRAAAARLHERGYLAKVKPFTYTATVLGRTVAEGLR